MPPESVSSSTERALRSYYRVHVPWNDVGGGVNVYFTDGVEFTEAGWVIFEAEGWLWSKEIDGANRTEYFDDLTKIALPRERVEEVYWPEVDHA